MLPVDFRVASQPADGYIWIETGISFGHQPCSFIQVKSDTPVTGKTCWDLFAKKITGNPNDKVAAMLFLGKHADAPSVTWLTHFNPSVLKDYFTHEQVPFEQFYEDQERNSALWGITFLLEEVYDSIKPDNILEFITNNLTISNILDVEPLNCNREFVCPSAWLFGSSDVISAETQRIQVETYDGPLLPENQKYLCRKLYADSSIVKLKSLHGGYSAQTFQVESFDYARRKLRPTVLKIAGRDMIAREAKMCQDYAMPFILNNSAMILGTSFMENMGVLRYNFVGIGGENIKLKWLAHYYEKWSVEELEPLFDKIFLDILHPWYGQPIEKQIYPFREHNPTTTFFSHLIETAEQFFSLSANEPSLLLEEIGVRLLNPYWFLKHQYPYFHDISIQFYSAVCHGDLNMQNILIDDNMNIYLIDFSETWPRSVVSDFARLEAIFMLEFANINSDDQWHNVLNLYQRIYQDEPFVQNFQPDQQFNGSIERNLKMSRKMR